MPGQKQKGKNNMHEAIFIVNIDTDIMPDEDDILTAAQHYAGADYIEKEDHNWDTKTFKKVINAIFSKQKEKNGVFTVQADDAKQFMDGIILRVKEHAKTITPETFQRWRDSLRFNILESGPSFIVDGAFMFTPEFISVLYNTARRSESQEVSFRLIGIYDMHI